MIMELNQRQCPFFVFKFTDCPDRVRYGVPLILTQKRSRIEGSLAFASYPGGQAKFSYISFKN